MGGMHSESQTSFILNLRSWPAALMIVCMGFLLFLSLAIFGQANFGYGKPMRAKSKMNCVSKELRLKSCRLMFGKAEYNLSREALRIHDGTWRGVVKLDFAEQTTDWQSVKIRSMAEKTLLEVKAWRRAASAPDLELENLHWMVFELAGTELKPLADKVVRLRRRHTVDEGQLPNQFLNGKLDSHLILVEDGKLLWKVGHKKGPLFPEQE
ncbi:MAG: hypothetical protein AAF202_00020 [Pseudomonadota bacterium]